MMKLNEITEVKASDLHQVRMYKSGALYITAQGLTSLEGCPEIIGGTFTCSDNHLTSFEHFPKFIGNNCYITGNKLITSFKDIDKHIEYIGGILFAFDMNITSGFLDLFGIDGLQGIEVDAKIQEIANKYLPTKDLINFQDEVIKAGFESYL